MHISLVLMELKLAASIKRKKKKNRPISSHLDLKLLTNAYGMWMRMSWNKPTTIHGIAKALTNEDTRLLFLWPLRVSRPFIGISLLILKHLKQQTLIQQFMSNHQISLRQFDIIILVNHSVNRKYCFFFFFVAFNKYIIIMCEVFHAH